MCYKKPGPRCSKHTEEILSKSISDLDKAQSTLEKASIRQSIYSDFIDYISTASGYHNLTLLLAEAKTNNDIEKVSQIKKLQQKAIAAKIESINEYNVAFPDKPNVDFQPSRYEQKKIYDNYLSHNDYHKAIMMDNAHSKLDKGLTSIRPILEAEDSRTNVNSAYINFTAEEESKGVDEITKDYLREKRRQNYLEAQKEIKELSLESAKNWYDNPHNNNGLTGSQKSILKKIKSYSSDDEETYMEEVERLCNNGITFDSIYISSPKKENFLEGLCLSIAERNLRKELDSSSNGKYRMISVNQLSKADNLKDVRFTSEGRVTYTQKDYLDSKAGKGAISSKSLDSAIVIEEDDQYHIFLATNKHADSAGGAQNNQFNDAIKSVRYLRKVLENSEETKTFESKIRAEIGILDKNKPVSLHPCGLLDGPFMRKESSQNKTGYPEFMDSDNISRQINEYLSK